MRVDTENKKGTELLFLHTKPEMDYQAQLC